MQGLQRTLRKIFLETAVWGNFVRLGYRKAGEVIKISCPLPGYTEKESIGNPGFRRYPYQIMWKGDTVLKIKHKIHIRNPGKKGILTYCVQQCQVETHFLAKEPHSIRNHRIIHTG